MASATQRSTEDTDWNLDWNSQLNIVYLNIDWKSSRHNTQESRARNKRTLQETIASIVAKMRPDILCMVEVGVASSLMTEEQLEAVAEWCMEQWKKTATGRAGAGWRSPEFFGGAQAWKAAQDDFSLSVLYAKDTPYMTIYNDKKCICTKNTTLHNLYKNKDNEPRTAQHMLFEPRTGAIGNLELVEIVSVHAPSGSKGRQLTDANRKELISNILQSESLENPATTIGHKNFLIGGDMNTAPGTLTELLSRAYSSQVVKEGPIIMPNQMAADVKPGDYCFLQGIRSELLSRRGARNHDPKHDPYGIKWIPARRREEHNGSTMASSSTSPHERKWMPKRRPATVFPAPAPKHARSESGQSPPPCPLSATPPCLLKATPPCAPVKATSPSHEEGKAGLPRKAKASAPKIATPKLPPPVLERRSPPRLKTIHEGHERLEELPPTKNKDEDQDQDQDQDKDEDEDEDEDENQDQDQDQDQEQDQEQDQDQDEATGDDDANAESCTDDDETERAPTPRDVELHRRLAPQQNRAQELLYNVLNAMLDHVSFLNDSAEAMLRHAVEGQESSMRFRSQTNGDINAIVKIFAPVFYELGDKKKYQAQPEQWQPKPKSTSATYIENWRQYSEMRAWWNRPTPISPLQVLEESEWKNVLYGERNQYKQQYVYQGVGRPKPQQWRTAYCVKLREETGDKRIAFAIWKLGMPERATVLDEINESKQLTSEMQERLATDAARILSWFYKVAVHCIQQDPNGWIVETSGATHPNPRSQCGPFLTQGGSETATASDHQRNAWQKESQKTNTGQGESWSHSKYAEWKATWHQHHWQGAWQQCSWKAGTWSE